jgi:hypothetical protein
MWPCRTENWIEVACRAISKGMTVEEAAEVAGVSAALLKTK